MDMATRMAVRRMVVVSVVARRMPEAGVVMAMRSFRHMGPAIGWVGMNLGPSIMGFGPGPVMPNAFLACLSGVALIISPAAGPCLCAAQNQNQCDG